MKVEKPKVSVWMLAYNHEKYIGQAIESVLMQKTDFKFDLIIGEDCSPDNTRQIILEYQKQYPDIIKPLLHSENVGLHQNFVQTLHKCTGKYVALLEGDDYWTDEQKLQQQVDFLDANEDYALCYQLSEELNEINGTKKITNANNPDTFGADYLLKRGWFIRTATILTRNDYFDRFPDWFYHSYSTDYIFQLMAAKHGKVKCLKKTTAIYRRHEGGITFAGPEKQISRYANILKLLDHLDEYFDFKYKKEIMVRKREIKNVMIVDLLKLKVKKTDILKQIIPLINRGTLNAIKSRIFAKMKN